MYRRNIEMKKIYKKPLTWSAALPTEEPLLTDSVKITEDEQSNDQALSKGITFNYDEMEDFSLVPYDSWGNETWNEEIGLSEYIHF